MFEELNKMPLWSRFLLVGILCAILSAVGTTELSKFFKVSEPTKVSILVRSEKTRKLLEGVEVKLLTNGAPISLKTDDSGYTETPPITSQSTIRLELSKPGYVTKQETLNTAEATKLHEVALSIDQQSSICFGDSCTDKIPQAAKCNSDAATTNYATGEQFSQNTGISNVVRVEVRYSQKCNANWAKAVAPIGAFLYLQDDKGSKYSEYQIPKDDLPDHHTEMVNGELRLRACVQTTQGSKPTCTGFVN